MLVLHGRSGLEEPTKSYASWLATQGYVALAPDYFAPISMPSGAWSGTDYQKHTDRIREDLAQGLLALKSLPYVDPNRIGVVGFSLGGYYACVLGTRNDVKCVVSYYGAYAGSPVNQVPVRYTLTEIASQMKASVLMFHGDADQLIPIANANTMKNLLISGGKQCEYVVYPGAGHPFDVKGGPLYDARVTADAQQRVVIFLRKKLQ